MQLADTKPAVRLTLGRRSWLGMAVFGWALAAVAVWWFGGGVAVFWQRLLLAGIVVGAGVTLRFGSVKFFGPLLYYDMLRAGRRRWLWAARFAYVAFLSIWFMMLWLTALANLGTEGPGDAFTNLTMSHVNAARLADEFLTYFLTFQFAAAVLLTPLFVAGAIVEEKDCQRMPFLLATDLHNQEIVVGVLLSRLINLLAVLLGGLPVLMLIQFLGGIDAGLLLAGFGVTALTIASMAGVSILVSVYSRRFAGAVIASYVPTAAYLLLTTISYAVAREVPLVGSYPSTEEWMSPVTVADVVEWASWGNVFIFAFTIRTSTAPASVLFGLMINYAWFHGMVFLGCTAWAVARVRAVAKQEVGGRRGRVREREVIPVGRHAMLWKEVWLQARLPRHRLAWIGTTLFALAALVPPSAIVGLFIYDEPYINSYRAGHDIAGRMNQLAVCGTVFASLLLVQVALRASASVTGERSKRTLDDLLTTPLSSREILFAKWLGSILQARRALFWLGVVWVIAYLCGGLSLWAFPCLALAWLVYAGFCAALGLYFSASSRTTFRASFWTILTIALVLVGPWMVFEVYQSAHLPEEVLGALGRADQVSLTEAYEYAEAFHGFSLTPPIALRFLALPRGGWADWLALLMVLFGLALYSLGALGFWWAALREFQGQTGRIVRPRPEPVAEESAPGDKKLGHVCNVS